MQNICTRLYNALDTGIYFYTELTFNNFIELDLIEQIKICLYEELEDCVSEND